MTCTGCSGRPCIIGGVHIPHDKALLGHSDADVLLHAIADAVLGALGLGDIGRHFPDTDPAYKDADSAELLDASVADGEGGRLPDSANVDATVMAQRPKMAPHIPRMEERHRRSLEAEAVADQREGDDDGAARVRRAAEEGIAAQAVVCLVKVCYDSAIESEGRSDRSCRTKSASATRRVRRDICISATRRTALIQLFVCPQQGGNFIIRIEDTDLKRNVAGGEENQLTLSALARH